MQKWKNRLSAQQEFFIVQVESGILYKVQVMTPLLF